MKPMGTRCADRRDRRLRSNSLFSALCCSSLDFGWCGWCQSLSLRPLLQLPRTHCHQRCVCNAKSFFAHVLIRVMTNRYHHPNHCRVTLHAHIHALSNDPSKLSSTAMSYPLALQHPQGTCRCASILRPIIYRRRSARRTLRDQSVGEKRGDSG